MGPHRTYHWDSLLGKHTRGSFLEYSRWLQNGSNPTHCFPFLFQVSGKHVSVADAMSPAQPCLHQDPATATKASRSRGLALTQHTAAAQGQEKRGRFQGGKNH